MITQLVSAFPGTGKSYFFNNTYLKVLDSDSSKFDKSNFPDNYIEHIKNNIGSYDIILISSHKEVRDALVKNKIDFTLVFPHKELKDEYIKRYRDRGNDEKFIELVEKNWDMWFDELYYQQRCSGIMLGSNEFISDLFNEKASKIEIKKLNLIR